MSKVLLAITSDSKNMKTMDEVIAPFEEEGYHVHFFADLGDIEFISLPKLVDYINEYEKHGIQRFVFLSDIKELVFAWYRCYNHLVDDFVYCINPQNHNAPFALTTTYNDFCRKLASFDGASEETLSGKIYIKINLENYKYISSFLLTNNRFQYFNDFQKFNFREKTIKNKRSKMYNYRQREYSFIIEPLHHNAPEKIQLDGLNKEDLNITNNILLFKEHSFFVPYACVTLLVWNSITVANKKLFISSLLNGIAGLQIEVKREIYVETALLLKSEKLDEEMELLFLFNFVFFKLDTNVIEITLNKINHSNIPGSFLYPILMTILANTTEEIARNYLALYNDYQKVMNKVVDSFKNSINLKISTASSDKKIAFLIGQMLNALHSPTAVLVNYAKNLKKYYPDYQIQIFVSDAFAYSPGELLYNQYFSSQPSINSKSIHEQLLADCNISIHYSNHLIPRKERLQNDIAAITNYNPELIFDLDGYNLVKELLYEYYPILELSMAGISRSNHADIYISAREESEILKQFERHDITQRKYYKHKHGVDFPDPRRVVSRDEYEIKESDFVMITVGNRLPSEVNEAFVDMVISFLRDKPNVKWFIVGTTELQILSNKYSDLVKTKVIFVQMEPDLAALYRICNVYLNPFRSGGGFSAGMAMKQSVPIMALAENSDVEVYIGTENCVQNRDDYVIELNKLYDDKNYAMTKGQLLKQRIEEKFSFKAAIDELVLFFERTKAEFQKRTYRK